MAGFPPQLAGNLFRTGNEDGGISRAARHRLDRDGVAGYAPGRFDDLTDRKAGAVTEVVDELLAGGKRLKSKQMGMSEVLDVDIVADAGAIGGRIVFAIDFDVVAAA